MRRKSSTVYFIGCNGRIKIGFTKSIEVRLKTFRTAHPDEIRLIGTVPASRHFEHELHVRLRQYVVKGEWFQDCPEVRAVIDDVLGGNICEAGGELAREFLEEIAEGSKAPPPRNMFGYLTEPQMAVFLEILKNRKRKGSLTEAAKTRSPQHAEEVRTVFATMDDPWQILVLSCIFPRKGHSPQESDRLDRELFEHLRAYRLRDEEAIEKVKAVLCLDPWTEPSWLPAPPTQALHGGAA
jgi:hypothetical protein